MRRWISYGDKMAIQSVNAINTAISTGAYYKTSWYKIFSTVTAGLAGSWYDTWQYTGMPSTGAVAGSLGTGYPMTGIGSAFTAGRISCGENVSPLTKHLINAEVMVTAATAMPCWLLLVDMLAYYPGIVMTTTTAQTVGNGTNVLTRYADGKGVMMYLSTTTATTTPATSTFTATYLNTASVSHASPTQNFNTVAGSGAVGALPLSGLLANNFAPFVPLFAGDIGVTAPTAVTVGSTQSGGTGILFLCKPLATIPIYPGPSNTTLPTAREYVFNMPSMPRIYDGACLSFLLYASGAVATSTNFFGTLDFVWG